MSKLNAFFRLFLWLFPERCMVCDSRIYLLIPDPKKRQEYISVTGKPMKKEYPFCSNCDQRYIARLKYMLFDKGIDCKIKKRSV